MFFLRRSIQYQMRYRKAELCKFSPGHDSKRVTGLQRGQTKRIRVVFGFA
jgi:hypothetical protein